jgi:alpha-ketoglutarate-dependent taurine dioxygenase
VETKLLSPHLGLEVRGIDIRNLTDEGALQLAALLLRHRILLIRDQDLDAAGQVRFSRRFGRLERFPRRSGDTSGDGDDEYVFRVSNDSSRGYKGVGLYWHTDGYFHERPTAVSILRAVTVPPHGGGTSFANMNRAFRVLPYELREEVRPLVGVSRPAPGTVRSGGLFARSSATGVCHPLVRRHPLTAEPVLYMNVGNMARIEGYDREQTSALLERLVEHLEEGDFTYHHSWETGDMILWDNAGTAHKASTPPRDSLRLMERTTIVGEEYFESRFWATAAAGAATIP